MKSRMRAALACSVMALLLGCTGGGSVDPANSAPKATGEARSPEGLRYLSQPLLRDIYIADPSAHVFDGRIYIYGSHDVDGTTPEDDLGSHFEMRDYRVVSLDRIGGQPTVHPVALDVKDVPWAEKQMWAPDAAYRNGKYYLYFPAKDREGVFRIGVATGSRPEGPFTAQPQPIRGSYSIDPSVFVDDRYAAWNEEFGQSILSKLSLAEIAEHAVQSNADVLPPSGRQEYLENLINRFV